MWQQQSDGGSSSRRPADVFRKLLKAGEVMEFNYCGLQAEKTSVCVDSGGKWVYRFNVEGV